MYFSNLFAVRSLSNARNKEFQTLIQILLHPFHLRDFTKDLSNKCSVHCLTKTLKGGIFLNKSKSS